MGFPIIDRALDEIIDDALGANPMPHEIGRKAQPKGSTAQEVLTLDRIILGTISRRNHPQGLSVDYTATEQGFPDGSDRMNFYADLTGVDEARLVANIKSGGGPGTVLAVHGGGELISIGLQIITSSPEIVEGTWHPVSATGATLLTWTIQGTSAGNVILGLCQLQGR